MSNHIEDISQIIHFPVQKPKKKWKNLPKNEDFQKTL